MLILSKESSKRRFAWKIFQDYQLTLMISKKMQTLLLTNINKVSKLLYSHRNCIRDCTDISFKNILNFFVLNVD